MQVSTMLNDKEIDELQQKFYEYFKTGYDFEEFLKEYLIRMGLDEVEITQRSRDGGVDLTAIRKGVGDFSELIQFITISKLKDMLLKQKLEFRQSEN